MKNILIERENGNKNKRNRLFILVFNLSAKKAKTNTSEITTKAMNSQIDSYLIEIEFLKEKTSVKK